MLQLALPLAVTDIGAAFRISDATGTALAFVYFRDGEGSCGPTRFLTPAAAQTVAITIAHSLVRLAEDRAGESPARTAAAGGG